jgi:glycerol kinase
MIPALAGLGAPHWLDRAPFVITGLGAETRGEDLLRASVEAIAYLVRDVYEAMRIKRGIREILVTGGVSKSDYLIQFQSDLLQVSLRRSLDAESSARGAALGAAIGAGLLSPEAIRPSKEGRVFCPRMSKKESDRLYRKWQGIMRAVKASGI